MNMIIKDNKVQFVCIPPFPAPSFRSTIGRKAEHRIWKCRHYSSCVCLDRVLDFHSSGPCPRLCLFSIYSFLKSCSIAMVHL